MKRADAALTASPVFRPEKPGRMKNQAFSFPLTVRPLTFSAIDVFGSYGRKLPEYSTTHFPFSRLSV